MIYITKLNYFIMKRKFYLSMAVLFAACVGSLSVQAQTTDVTSTYLTNADFETSPTGAAVDNTIYDVAGWVETPVAGVLNYNKLATVGYESVTGALGTAPVNASSVTTGNSTLLGVKVHWGPAELYISQTVNLPIGKYTMTWDSYLAQVVTSQASRCGYIIDGTATYDDLPTAINTWKNHSLTFTLTSAKDVTFRMGYNKTANVGSTSSPILFVDNVKLLKFNQVDKTTLQGLLATATTMSGNPQPVGTSTVYADLTTAINAAQLVYDNAAATLVEVAAQESALTAAIAAVNGAITLEARTNSWTNLPYAATSIISNPSFESELSVGWTSLGGLGRATNANIGAFKAGTYYLEKWVASPGTQSNINLSQVLKNVPNGMYKITAAAQAVQQSTPVAYPGKAYVFANADSVEVFELNNYTVQTTVTNNTLNIGYAVKTTGNWVSVDNFQVIYLGTGPKSVLKSALDSAKVMVANPVTVGSTTVYPNLSTAVSAAQVVYDNVAATTTEISDQVTALNNAIAAVHAAILLQTRINTWTTLPYDATSVISNPSFENSATAGWTNVGGFASQNNTSFSFKAGTYYVEKWQSSGNWTGLKLSQTIKNIPNGVYNLTAAALNNPVTTGGAFVYANMDSVEVFSPNDYTVLVKVTNNQLEIGYKVLNGGNYVAVDNFRLSYVSDGTPYVVLAPTTLFFDPNHLTKTFNVSGGNLTSALTLTAPAGISLDKTSLTAAEVAAGAVITATFDNATVITNGVISATSATLTQNVTVNTSADLSCFTPLYSTLTNLIPDPYLNDLSGFGGWGHKSVVLGEAYCGAACVKFDATTNGYPDGAALDVSSVNWTANHKYRVRVMVKTVDGTLGLLAKGTSPDFSMSIPQSGTNWITIDTTFTAGVGAAANFFTINNVDAAATGKIAYIDNYELYDLGLGTGVKTVGIEATRVFTTSNTIVADFELRAAGTVEFNIYNVQGMLVAKNKSTFDAGLNQKVMNVNLPSGVYLINVINDGKQATFKVVK